MNEEQRAHLDKVRQYVPLAESRGVPGAVLMAQATIESGWGKSGLSRNGNAFFGVKGRSGWPGKVYSGTTYEFERGQSVKYPGTGLVYDSFHVAVDKGLSTVSLFRAYDNFADNVNDYLEFYNRNPRYRKALENYASTKDARQFARDIHSAGYATSPTYAPTLISFMEQYCADLLSEGDVKSGVSVLVERDGRRDGLPISAVRVMEDQRVFVHVRALVDLLGLKLDFDPKTKTIVITE